uniref:Reverse transcriptase (RNA-dependent DNA polymerase) n=1 Tax=Candidatus Kentrum sp. TC TaxID=2126339 RepID=A0A450YQ71_9GAMM|nr:MAG: hypothetical protein BECKTC1821D_GA0114238_101729 [Candidatus Kentron sp. TC]
MLKGQAKLSFVVLCKSRRQTEKALLAVTYCNEGKLGLQPSTEKTHIASFRDGYDFLGFYVRATSLPYGGDKAEARFRDKTREIARRSHNVDRNVVGKVNRGAVNYCGKPAYSSLGQFDKSDPMD